MGGEVRGIDIVRSAGLTGHLLAPRHTQLATNTLLGPSQHEELEQGLTLLKEALVVESESEVEAFAEGANRRRGEDLRCEEVEQSPDYSGDPVSHRWPELSEEGTHAR